MSAESDNDKISQAVQSCLAAGTLNCDRPFLAIKEYIESLKASPDWTDPEIMEVQMQIIRALMSEKG